MDLGDFDTSFFEEGWRTLYGWFPERDKVRIRIELERGDMTFEDLIPRVKFFYLLSYLENNYVNYLEKLIKTQGAYSTLKISAKGDLLGLQLPISSGDYKPVESIISQVGEDPTVKELSNQFYEMLKDISVDMGFEDYKEELAENKKGKEPWF